MLLEMLLIIYAVGYEEFQCTIFPISEANENVIVFNFFMIILKSTKLANFC